MRDDAVVDSTGVDAVLDTMGAIRQRFSRAHRAQCARAVILSLLWACASSSLIFLNNHLLRERGFSYPMMLCTMGMLSSWLIACALVHTGRVKLKHEAVVTRRWYARHILPIGSLGAVSLGFGNYVYLYLSVSFIQMLKSAVPAVTLVVMTTAGLEKLHGTTLLGVGIVTLGTFIAAYGEVKFSAIGVVMMIVSEFAEAIRMAFYQYVLGNLKFDLIEGLYVMGPAALLFLGLGIVMFELRDFLDNGAWYIPMDSPHHFFAAALLGFGVNYLTLGVIKATSGLTFKVMGQVKNAVVILLAVVIFGNPVTSIQLFGYTLSLVGFFIYQRGKSQQLVAAIRDRDAASAKE
jgi:drug/metabolite transporter (DMT)-like permease|tara:strand:+ start:2848 stop:3891 length:1044 start_codon:yes stop_codon:yes gene_type:complete